MPIKSVEVTDSYVEFDLGGGPIRINYSDIPGNSWNQSRLNKFVERAQALLDTRIPLADLPADDPDKTTDPARTTLFWDGTDLVARHVLLETLSFDGTRLRFVVRRVR